MMFLFCYAQCLGFFIAYHIYVFKYFATLCLVWFPYHDYARKFIGHRIFQHWVIWLIIWSFYFKKKEMWPSFSGLTCYLHLLGMLGFDCSCTCHSFLVGWSYYSFWCSGTCQNWHLSLVVNTAWYLNFITPCCPLSNPWGPPLIILWYSHIFTYMFF